MRPARISRGRRKEIRKEAEDNARFYGNDMLPEKPDDDLPPKYGSDTDSTPDDNREYSKQ